MEDVIGVGEAGQAFLPDAHGAASIQDPVEEASVLFRLVCFNKSKLPFLPLTINSFRSFGSFLCDY